MKQVVDLRAPARSTPSKTDAKPQGPPRVLRQEVNLRSSYVRVYADRDQQREWERECDEARSRQVVMYAVAPRRTLTLHDGRTKGPGEQVFVTDFVHQDEVPPFQQLRSVIERAIVLQADSAPEPTAA